MDCCPYVAFTAIRERGDESSLARSKASKLQVVFTLNLILKLSISFRCVRKYESLGRFEVKTIKFSSKKEENILKQVIKISYDYSPGVNLVKLADCNV